LGPEAEQAVVQGFGEGQQVLRVGGEQVGQEGSRGGCNRRGDQVFKVEKLRDAVAKLQILHVFNDKILQMFNVIAIVFELFCH
jgi:hypothetical protein